MFDLAQAIRATGQLRPLVVLATEALSTHAADCRRADLPFVDVTPEIERRQHALAPHLHRLMKRFEPWCKRHDRLGNALLPSLLRMRHLRNRLRGDYSIFWELCVAEKPAAIIIPGDRELPPVPALLQVGLDLGVPTIIEFAGVPYGSGLELSRAPYNRFRTTLRHLPPLLNIVAARRFPEQVTLDKSGPLLFSPGWITWTLYRVGILSANPWIQGCGACRYVFQQDRGRLRRFLEKGLPPEKAVLVGDPALDPLYEAWVGRDELRLRLNRSYRLDPKQRLVIMAVPNDAEHDVCDWPTHLDRMDRYFSRLADGRAQVLLSLHPKADRNNYQPLVDRHGLQIADETLADMLPAADLFVCSGSSTIFWAKLCAVPIINLDYLDVMDADFGGIGVVNVNDEVEFSDSLARFHAGGGTAIVGDLSSSSQAFRDDHLFDGQATDRICAFLRDLARGHAPSGGAGIDPGQCDAGARDPKTNLLAKPAA